MSARASTCFYLPLVTTQAGAFNTMEHRGPRLPLELQEAIIDEAPAQSLKACSLTCKALALRSRMRLFQAISLNEENVDSFLHFLSVSPGTAIRVRSLRLSGLVDCRPLLWLVTHVPRIRRLHLHSVDWCDWEDELRRAILTGLPFVDTLVLQGVAFEYWQETAQLVSAFPLLNSLDSDRCLITFHEGNPPFSDPRSRFKFPSALKHLRALKVFENCSILIRWILTFPSLPPIQSIEFTCSTLRDLIGSGLNILLQVLGSSLKSLTIISRERMPYDQAFFDSTEFSRHTRFAMTHPPYQISVFERILVYNISASD